MGDVGHWGLIKLGDNRIAGGVLKGELACGKSGLSDLLAICEGSVIKGGKNRERTLYCTYTAGWTLSTFVQHDYGGEMTNAQKLGSREICWQCQFATVIIDNPV